MGWGPPCILRYANRSIFGLLELEPTDAGYNVNNITSNMEEFDQTWGGLMSRIVTKASMGSSKLLPTEAVGFINLVAMGSKEVMFTNLTVFSDGICEDLDENRSKECLKFNFETIRLATEDFSDHNKLGQGGFGAVYKGVLSDGQVVAVKRLSRNSKQEEVILRTSGYMAPEYAFQGILSVKSDVFSFGVLILEIISGQKCNKFRNGEEEEERDLITYAWDNWIEGTASNIIDPILIGAASTPDILRCIQIGLLCVQADAGKRPTMASVVLMLDSCSVALPALSKPGYFVYSEHTSILSGNQSKSRSAQLSANQCSISELEPR
ncbi:hypothetical protein GH714_016747 [Hevea brasiliensis]|uniref:Serine-threonine/tyrosine-protein kinase catalytic domain-containing protein n=1 Tax=Hevea brasiliensis TaxID=3981 RepID=A0A6A6N2G2_HEVBR|nr:hypothetical protein GH714_016747 [Hevea brasiliensis]